MMLPSQCPSCYAPWPPVTADTRVLSQVVCPKCHGIFDDGVLRPPRPRATAPPPLPLQSALRLRDREYRVVGFASWTYDIEVGRDTYDTYYRHEYTLMDVAGAVRLLCWGWGQWWLAQPVDADLVTLHPGGTTDVRYDGRTYKMHSGTSASPERACGAVARPFDWTSDTFLREYIDGPFGPGGRVVIGDVYRKSKVSWVGEFLDARELPAFPPGSVYGAPVVVAAPGPVSYARPVVANRVSSSQLLRTLGIMCGVLLLFAVLIGVGFLYDRQTKKLEAHWFACPSAQPQRFVLPDDAGKIELDPHLPQGALNYEVRVLDAGGTVVTQRSDFLDMSTRRRTMTMNLEPRSKSVEVGCSLSMTVAGLRTWPVELRFFR